MQRATDEEKIQSLSNECQRLEMRVVDLEAALRDVRTAVIANANDVLWQSSIETVVDRIDSALLDLER